MGEWTATVLFPDGTRLYTRYSTVTHSAGPELHRSRYEVGQVLPDGSTCLRAAVAGDPEPSWPGAEVSAPENLTLVVVRDEPDHRTWRALYCPRRGRLLGPLSSFHAATLQQHYELVADGQGVRHLCGWPTTGQGVVARVGAACGRVVTGTVLPFRSPGFWETGAEEPPDVDLVADWPSGTVCRECLLSQLPDVVEPPPGT